MREDEEDLAGAQRLLRRIDVLRDDPRGPGGEKLAGTSEHHRVRQGRCRIVNGIDDAVLVVEVVRVAHRSEACGRE